MASFEDIRRAVLIILETSLERVMRPIWRGLRAVFEPLNTTTAELARHHAERLILGPRMICCCRAVIAGEGPTSSTSRSIPGQ